MFQSVVSINLYDLFFCEFTIYFSFLRLTPPPPTPPAWKSATQRTTLPCVLCVTGCAATGNLALLVELPEPVIFSIILPLSSSLYLWHYGVSKCLLSKKFIFVDTVNYYATNLEINHGYILGHYIYFFLMIIVTLHFVMPVAECHEEGQ